MPDRSEGRRYPERPHPYRSDYGRDRDRVIHSKAFRRLENKTQVFHPDYCDHFRNRLTHTFEVSQISRTISQAMGLNNDLSEVLALGHDIGHPPFSHQGEKVLDQIMKQYGSGFDHNLHGLRIVEYFEEKYASFRGLNLTFEVREGMVKHSRDYTGQEDTYIDISDYRPGERPPLEAQLIDLADEIAYNSADLDDGYDAGLLSVEQMFDQVEFFREEYLKVERKHPGVAEKLKVRETVRRMIDVLASSLIRQSKEVLEGNRIDCVDKVRAFPTRLLGFDEETAAFNWGLKSFLRANLYDHEVLKKSRENTRRTIQSLFDYYAQDPQGLPQGHYAQVASVGLERVICDYIAGMTDKYAQSRYVRIFGSAG